MQLSNFSLSVGFPPQIAGSTSACATVSPAPCAPVSGAGGSCGAPPGRAARRPDLRRNQRPGGVLRKWDALTRRARQTIDPKQQLQLAVTIEIKGHFAHPLPLALSFDAGADARRLSLFLPVYPHKFAAPLPLDPGAFKSKWAALLFTEPGVGVPLILQVRPRPLPAPTYARARWRTPGA
jgi:hypothetical protein